MFTPVLKSDEARRERGDGEDVGSPAGRLETSGLATERRLSSVCQRGCGDVDSFEALPCTNGVSHRFTPPGGLSLPLRSVVSIASFFFFLLSREMFWFFFRLSLSLFGNKGAPPHNELNDGEFRCVTPLDCVLLSMQLDPRVEAVSRCAALSLSFGCCSLFSELINGAKMPTWILV